MEKRDRPELGNFLAGRIAVMEGVRGGDEGYPVELWRESGRLVIRAFNEAGFSFTDIDLYDLIAWLRSGPNPDLIQG